MSMTLTDIRTRGRQASRNARNSTDYNNAQLDEALDRLMARFLRVTSCVKIATTVTMTASTNTADFSSLSAFLAGRIERARILIDANYTTVYEDLEIIPAGDIYDRLNCDTSTGTPCKIGFTDSATAKLFPAPSDNGTITVVYCPLQTPWTLGTRGTYSASATYVPDDVVISSGTLYRAILTNTNVAVGTASTWENLGAGTLVAPGSITSVIPDGLLSELIGTGAPAILQAVDPKQRDFTGPKWEAYLAFENSCRGIGSISGKQSGGVSVRTNRWG